MTVLRLVRFRLAEGRIGVAEDLAATLVPQIRALPGCIEAFAFVDDEGEGGLVVRWRAADDADAASAVIGPQLMMRLRGSVEGPPDIRLFDVVGEAPLPESARAR